MIVIGIVLVIVIVTVIVIVVVIVIVIVIVIVQYNVVPSRGQRGPPGRASAISWRWWAPWRSYTVLILQYMLYYILYYAMLCYAMLYYTII